MATSPADSVFVDANILIYARQAHSPFHQAALSKLAALALAGRTLWTSRQVLREYLAGMSRPSLTAAPPPMASLIADVRFFVTKFIVVEDGPTVTHHLLDLLSAIPCFGKQVHDANIVATLLSHGIPMLLTHNVADFTRYGAHITVLPLIPSTKQAT